MMDTALQVPDLCAQDLRDRMRDLVRMACAESDTSVETQAHLSDVVMHYFRSRRILFADREWCARHGLSSAFLMHKEGPVLFLQGKNGLLARYRLVGREAGTLGKDLGAAFASDIASLSDATWVLARNHPPEQTMRRRLYDMVLKGAVPPRPPTTSLPRFLSDTLRDRELYVENGHVEVDADRFVTAIKSVGMADFLLSRRDFLAAERGDRGLVCDCMSRKIPDEVLALYRDRRGWIDLSQAATLASIAAFLSGAPQGLVHGPGGIERFVALDADFAWQDLAADRMAWAREQPLAVALADYCDIWDAQDVHEDRKDLARRIRTEAAPAWFGDLMSVFSVEPATRSWTRERSEEAVMWLGRVPGLLMTGVFPRQIATCLQRGAAPAELAENLVFLSGLDAGHPARQLVLEFSGHWKPEDIRDEDGCIRPIVWRAEKMMGALKSCGCRTREEALHLLATVTDSDPAETLPECLRAFRDADMESRATVLPGPE